MELLFNPQKTLGDSRYAWIDYAKGICIILVTFRHVQEGLHPAGEEYLYPGLKFADVFFFSFRMPLFFIISGIFLAGEIRKKSVNDFIQRVYNEIKKEKKHVKFGLSPFGIWQPGYQSPHFLKPVFWYSHCRCLCCLKRGRSGPIHLHTCHQ